MKLERIDYFVNGKKKSIFVKKVSISSPGLMFRRKSPPLFFSLSRERIFSIFSFFCRPFKAIWLDNKMRATKIVNVRKWRFRISGRGKYLLEIPEPLKNDKLSTENNRKV